MTLRDHLGPRTDATAALHDELDQLLAAPAAVLMEARHRVNETIAERQADLHGARNSFNKGAVDALQEVQARIRDLTTTDSTDALKRVIGRALRMARGMKPLEWKASAVTYTIDRIRGEEANSALFWEAETNLLICSYSIMQLVDPRFAGDREGFRLTIKGIEHNFPTLEAAKAAAQADYQQRSDAMRQSITADDVLRELGGRG